MAVVKKQTVVIASGASTSSFVDLGDAQGNVFVRVGTMSTGSAVQLQNSDDGGTTYYYAFHPTIQSATVATPQFLISGAVGSGGGFVALPFKNLQTIRFVTTAVVSGGVSFAVLFSQ